MGGGFYAIIHGVISLPDVTSCEKFGMAHCTYQSVSGYGKIAKL